MYGYGYGRRSWGDENQDNPSSLYGAYARNDYRHRDYQYRLREQDYGYVICRYCSNHHRNEAQKCYIMCEYCHGIHFKKDLKLKNNNFNSQICPLILVSTIQQQKNKAFDCEQCGGHGTYEKYVVTTYRQPLTSFKRRQQDYEELRSEFGEEGLEVPEHRIYTTKESTEIESCLVCKGKGKIFRVTECCQNGCSDCKHSRIKINPKWRQIRLKGQPNKEEVFPCRICNEQVDLSQKILKLNCGHAFHRNCILRELALRKHYCFICQEKDPYLEGEDFKEYLDSNENHKLKNVVKKVNPKKESPPLDEVALRDKYKLPLSDVSFSRSSSWLTEKQSDEGPNVEVASNDLDDSLKFYVNTIREQNQRLMSNVPPESDKSLHFISESDTPNHLNVAAQNDLSIAAKTKEPSPSDCGSFSESSIKLNSSNISNVENHIDEETRSVKSEGGSKKKEPTLHEQ